LDAEPAAAAGLGRAHGRAQRAQGREGEQHDGAERRQRLEAEGRVERQAVVSYRRAGVRRAAGGLLPFVRATPGTMRRGR
jgi:hypothetical protein